MQDNYSIALFLLFKFVEDRSPLQLYLSGSTRTVLRVSHSHTTCTVFPSWRGFNMFHVFALTYYILLHCVTHEYNMTSVNTKNYSIYATREYTTTNDEKYSIYATREYSTIFDLHDAYYSLLERYMKHVFVAGLVTGDLTCFMFLLSPTTFCCVAWRASTVWRQYFCKTILQYLYWAPLVQHIACADMCPVRSLIGNLWCSLPSLPLCWTYLSVGLFKLSWLVPYFRRVPIQPSFFSVERQ